MPLRYLLVLTIPLATGVSFLTTGWLTFLPVIYAFGILPFLELFLKPDASNLTKEEAMDRSNRVIYDFLLYLIVPVQYGMLIWFLFVVDSPELTIADKTGRTLGMGLLCGILGINVAHELGHRVKKSEQFMSKALLLTSLYMHFFIEHNRGHHRHVSTPEDPSSARLNEWLPVFWMRSIIKSYLSAWSIENGRVKRRNLSVITFQNEMILFSIVQLAFVAAVFFLFGTEVTAWFTLSAISGILLLETVNYIEHYGLQRRKVSPNRYENATPEHSWNSNHAIGRMVLFELSRHSDHHYMPSKKYQILDHHDHSPQLPTGYPGMMLLSFIPPLWCAVMNHRLRLYHQARHNQGE